MAEVAAFEINWIAFLVNFMLCFLIGWLWYSPMVFGKQFVAALGVDPSQSGAKPTTGMVFQIPTTALEVFWIGFLVYLCQSLQLWWIVPLYIVVMTASSITGQYWSARNPMAIAITAGQSLVTETLVALVFWIF
ncbi:MAG: DUF1761 domain-containing protein [Alphaproteobacteria bacterium]|nr:DUF1761 domain-containing protein [Alphaproteobacteria bacterium]